MESLPTSRRCELQPIPVAAVRETVSMSRTQIVCAIFLAGLFVAPAIAQKGAAAILQTGIVRGTVTDANDGIVPGADVVLKSSDIRERRTVESGDDGSYSFDDLHPGIIYHITISSRGFVTWTSPDLMLAPGETRFLPESKLQPTGDGASVTVYASPQQIAIEQVKMEEQQRAFGFIPNFYVAYDRNAVPLTAKLKFKLALKASTDPVIFAAVAFIAGADQAGDAPDYGQGAKGYGQRMGALYANGFTDIMVGEAILPSLLHQDPRYFYQGTGSKRSRVFHALASAFTCRGDNGRLEPNYSSIGGDLAAGAISNIYYPRSNRGVGIVFENALITSGGRMANGLVQEFILRRFTSSARNRTP